MSASAEGAQRAREPERARKGAEIGRFEPNWKLISRTMKLVSVRRKTCHLAAP